MLPRLSRPGGGTRGARRKSMRPWHEPGGVGGAVPLNGTMHSVCWRPERPRLRRGALRGGGRTPHHLTPTGPPPLLHTHSGHRATAPAVNSGVRRTLRFGHSLSTRPRHPLRPAPPVRRSTGPPGARSNRPRPSGARPFHGPAGVPRRAFPRSAREMACTSRAGPPPAGNGAAVSPSPPSPVRRADPRTLHGSASTPVRRERTAGRTATRPEHIRHGSPPPPDTRAVSGTGNNPAIRTDAP